jgi:uncharacterized protein (DUF1697 family)
MAKRLTEAAKPVSPAEQNEPEPEVLVRSLAGAMGEIEQLFGREAATLAMAVILTETEGGVTEENFLASLQSALAGLKRYDPNGLKLKQLTEGFNRDLALALDQELAAKNEENGQAFSLSYALARHYGSLGSLMKAEDEVPEGTEAAEVFMMMGFTEEGKWAEVQVQKSDSAAAVEIRQKAESGLNKAADLTMAKIMEYDDTAALFQELVNFLDAGLQDREAALFAEKCLADSEALLRDKYGNSPEITKMLGQIYSQVAAEGDEDKLRLLENYLNTDFKDALNPILAKMQKDGLFGELADELGALQFKGITGLSEGQEDKFSFSWGYEDDSAYDQIITKYYLQEDIREVKRVTEKKEEDAAWKKAELLAETGEARLARESVENLPGNKAAAEEVIDKGAAVWARFQAEKRQDHLNEFLGTKFGQLSQESRDQLTQYLESHFSEEEAEKLLEHTKWNNDIMAGLAGIEGAIKAMRTDSRAQEELVRFLNSQVSPELEKIAARLDGLNFDGFEVPAGESAEPMTANLHFAGQKGALKTAMVNSEPAMTEESDETGLPAAEEAPKPAEAILAAVNDPVCLQRLRGTGYLISLGTVKK